MRLLSSLVSALCLGAALVSADFSALSTDAPFYKTTTHPAPPSTKFWALESSFKDRAHPTNAWFENIVLGSGENPIMMMPFQAAFRTDTSSVNELLYKAKLENRRREKQAKFLRAADAELTEEERAQIYNETATLPRGLTFSLPTRQSSTSLVATFFQPAFMFTAVENINSHQVVSYDELSVTARFSASSGSGSIKFPLVRGSPYITAIYDQLTAKAYTINAILNVNGKTAYPATITGTRKVSIYSNDGSTYLLYVNQDVTFNWQDVNTITVTKASSNAGALVLRFARLSSSGQESVFDTYADTYPIGGSVTYQVDSTAKILNSVFSWKTAGGSNLLMAALPHQQTALVGPAYTSVQFVSVKGVMKTLPGSVWKLKNTLVDVDFTVARGVSNAQYKASIIQQLANDYSINIDSSTDPYGTGKVASAMARLMLIAKEFGQTDIMNKIAANLERGLEKWYTGTNPDTLLYDQSWGGIVPTDGLKDVGADYGAGYYNDHHFHFGYFLYATAALATVSPSFATKHKSAIYDLARDIANPRADLDTHFPAFRHFDHYDGHSWAAGLFEFGDSRDEESSSECMNAWYGLFLLGKAMGDKNMEDLGHTLLSLELVGVKKYWHSTTANSVYPADFAANKCAGQVWGDKVVDATWFASGPVYVHGINFLPYTPFSEFYMTEDWVKEEWPVVNAGIATSAPTPSEAWLGLIYGSLAVIDPAKAWGLVSALTSFDNGNTKTNMFYWIATRAAAHEQIADSSIIDEELRQVEQRLEDAEEALLGSIEDSARALDRITKLQRQIHRF